MEHLIKTTHYDSPCGPLTLGSLGDRLCLCDWQVEGHSDRVGSRLRHRLSAEFVEASSEVTSRAARELDEYFAGQRKAFDLPLLFAGTAFQKAVWSELLHIAYGETLSYAELALRLGMPRAVRAVANANGANALSLFVPCHRVIGSRHTLTGYAGGLAAKEYLLRLEGWDGRTEERGERREICFVASL